MGGKQKRAAKYKKWIEAQNHLAQMKEANAVREQAVPDPETDHEQECSGSSSSEYRPIPYKVQLQMMRHRRKTKKVPNAARWLLKRVKPFENGMDNLPTWIRTILGGMALSVLSLMCFRFVVQNFAPLGKYGFVRNSVMDHARALLPLPLFKLFQMADYLITSPFL